MSRGALTYLLRCAHALLQAQVQARVRKWYQLLQTFKKQPDSIEFVYLRHADPDSTQWNPYNIEVVPHAGVKVWGCRVAELVGIAGVGIAIVGFCRGGDEHWQHDSIVP